MKNKKKKLILIGLVISLTLFILCILLGESLATNQTTGNSTTESINWFESTIDGLVGVLLLPAKFILIILGAIASMVMGLFAENGVTGFLSGGGGITIQDILFNKVELLNVDFFDFSSSNSVISTIRDNVAIWYTSIRNLAAVILAIMAIYVGIRMALSTIAEDRAKYKTMLVDWLTSLALLFLLNYIMVITIDLNNAFVDLLSSSLKETTDMSSEFLDRAVLEVSFTSGMTCAIIYFLLQIVTFVFFLTYLRRMITIAFLMVISPLVTVTYSIDKMGDGKAQALNKWLKEFIYNILIQPFHCVSYLVLGTTAFNLIYQNNGWAGDAGIANAVIAIAMIIFIYSAEGIVKKIFHFESDSMGDTVSNAAVGMTIFSKLGSSSSRRQTSRSPSGSRATFGDSNTANNDNTNSYSSTTRTVRQVNNEKVNNDTMQIAKISGSTSEKTNSNNVRSSGTTTRSESTFKTSNGNPTQVDENVDKSRGTGKTSGNKPTRFKFLERKSKESRRGCFKGSC